MEGIWHVHKSAEQIDASWAKSMGFMAKPDFAKQVGDWIIILLLVKQYVFLLFLIVGSLPNF